MKSSQVAKKSLALISLMLLGSCHAQPPTKREQRQLKSAAATTEADVKMLAVGTANMTPAMNPMAMNPMAMQLGRYNSYPGLVFGGGVTPSAPFLGVSALQTGSYSAYPTDPNLSLGYGLPLGGFTGHNPAAGLMYGNPMFGNPQLANVAGLDNIYNMQGLTGNPSSLYPQAAVGGIAGIGGVPGASGIGGFGGMPHPGYFPGHPVGLEGGLNMPNYAAGF